MPKLTISGKGHEVESGKRLVLAIEGAGVDIGHRCGGNARCTTCRVEFIEGEPTKMTKAEFGRLHLSDLYGKARLSCQITCEHDMSVNPLVTAQDQPNWSGDTGPAPEEQITPDPEWIELEE
jgi:ferredoxin